MKSIVKKLNALKKCLISQSDSFIVSTQGENMGRKGVSKRKAKKTKTAFTDKANNTANGNLPIQLLTKYNESISNKGISKPAESKKKSRKGK